MRMRASGEACTSALQGMSVANSGELFPTSIYVLGELAEGGLELPVGTPG